MGRKLGQLKVEFISDKKSRFQTLKRRKECLMKKAKELSTLCDVNACLIVHAPEHASSVWPPNDPALVDRLIRQKRAAKNPNSKNDGNETQLGVRLDQIAQQVKAEIDRLMSDQKHQFASTAAMPSQDHQFGPNLPDNSSDASSAMMMMMMPQGPLMVDDRTEDDDDELKQRGLIMGCNSSSSNYGDFYHSFGPVVDLDSCQEEDLMMMPPLELMKQRESMRHNSSSSSSNYGGNNYPEPIIDQYPQQQQQFDLFGGMYHGEDPSMMMIDDSADQSCWAGFDDHGASCSTQTACGDDDVAAVDNDDYDFVAQLHTPPKMTWTDDDLKFTHFQENGPADFWKCIDFEDLWA